MGKKNRHSKDRLYLTATEWALEYGGKKTSQAGAISRPLPFDHCALSLTPFENPVCTKEGVIFDYQNLLGYIKEHHSNPVSGDSMGITDIIKLNMEKDDQGHWQCPITKKSFNNTMHIVAIKPSGNVFSFEAVNELNLKAKNFTDLLTGDPLEKSDIITLQNPNDSEVARKRDINNFVHLQRLRETVKPATSADGGEQKIRTNPTGEKILKEISRKRAEQGPLKSVQEITAAHRKAEFVDDVQQLLDLQALTSDVIEGQVSTSGQASGSLTSSVAGCWTSNATRLASADELRSARWRIMRQLGKKGYVQLKTTLGNLNLEIYCDWAPLTSFNFISLVERGYYNNTKFHRLIPNFMVQGGDPTGTGHGGESIWKTPFKDEFDSRIWHTTRGVLSMANSGPNTNKSQFFLTFREAPHLNNKHSVFGRLVGGAAVLDRIEQAATNPTTSEPTTAIVINEAVVVSSPIAEATEILVQNIEKNIAERRAAAAKSALPSRSGNVEPSIASSALSTVSSTQRGLETSDASVSSNQPIKSVGRAESDRESFLQSHESQFSSVVQAKKKQKTGFGNFSGW